MKRFSIILIIAYFAAGFTWLVIGSWMINKLAQLSPSTELQYLYDIKDMIFLFVSIVSIVLIINNRYNKLLSKQQVLNRQLSSREEQLQRMIKDYKFVNKATNDVIWDYNIDKDELKWSHGYQELFGYQDGLIVKASFWNMQKIHPEDREAIIAMFQELLKGQRLRWTAEYRYVCKNGDYKYVSDRGYLILDEYQRPVRMLGAIQDINRSKTYSRLLEAQNASLKKIAWLNSHEVRRPLCNITGLIPLIKASIDDREGLKVLLDLLETSADELDETVHRVNEHTASFEVSQDPAAQ